MSNAIKRDDTKFVFCERVISSAMKRKSQSCKDLKTACKLNYNRACEYYDDYDCD